MGPRRRNPYSLKRAWGYHGTASPQSVARHGLLMSRRGRGWGHVEQPPTGGIYFTKIMVDAVDAAIAVARNSATNKDMWVGVFKFDLKGLLFDPDEDLDLDDEDYANDGWMESSFHTMSSVSAKRIIWAAVVKLPNGYFKGKGSRNLNLVLGGKRLPKQSELDELVEAFGRHYIVIEDVIYASP